MKGLAFVLAVGWVRIYNDNRLTDLQLLCNPKALPCKNDLWNPLIATVPER